MEVPGGVLWLPAASLTCGRHMCVCVCVGRRSLGSNKSFSGSGRIVVEITNVSILWSCMSYDSEDIASSLCVCVRTHVSGFVGFIASFKLMSGQTQAR